MQVVAGIRQMHLTVINWRYSASVPLKIFMAVAMAAVTGLLAQVRLPLPFTPVPVTGQTLAVLLTGALLGRKWGAISLGIYGVLGLAGVPWLNGGAAGFGASAGYLVGFVLAALFIGYFTDGGRKVRSFYSLLAVMLFATLVIVYIPGVLWLGGWLKLVLHDQATVGTALSAGVWPFVAGDILKAVMAAGIAWLILPKTSDPSRT